MICYIKKTVYPERYKKNTRKNIQVKNIQHYLLNCKITDKILSVITVSVHNYKLWKELKK